MNPSVIESKTPRWGFVGAGQMASALVKGMIRAKVASPDEIFTYDPIVESAKKLGVTVLEGEGCRSRCLWYRFRTPDVW